MKPVLFTASSKLVLLARKPETGINLPLDSHPERRRRGGDLELWDRKGP